MDIVGKDNTDHMEAHDLKEVVLSGVRKASTEVYFWIELKMEDGDSPVVSVGIFNEKGMLRRIKCVDLCPLVNLPRVALSSGLIKDTILNSNAEEVGDYLLYIIAAQAARLRIRAIGTKKIRFEMEINGFETIAEVPAEEIKDSLVVE